MIREIARLARIAQEEYEKCSRAEEREKARAKIAAELNEKERWDAYESLYRNTPAVMESGGELHVIDLKADPTLPTALFAYAEPSQGENCPICFGPQDVPAYGTEEQAGQGVMRMLPCKLHAFHPECLIQTFSSVSKARCPMCRMEFQVVFKNGFETPKYRWYADEQEYWQVDGRLEFPLRGPEDHMDQFRVGQQVDPWGDLIENFEEGEGDADRRGSV